MWRGSFEGKRGQPRTWPDMADSRYMQSYSAEARTGTVWMSLGCTRWGAYWHHLVNVIEPSTCGPPLPSNRHHRSSVDCLEGKGENYQVCYVQYCVQQLCTVQCTHIWTDLTGLWIGFCLTGPISLCLDSFLCMYGNVCIFCMTVYCMNV